MRIEAPAATSTVKMWRAHFDKWDRPTPELMAPIMARYGLELYEGYAGENTNAYLVAAAGTSLDATLRVIGQESASRIDARAIFKERWMVEAAACERIGCDSYQDFSTFCGEFAEYSNYFSAEDAAYLAAFYYVLLPNRGQRIKVQSVLRGAATLMLHENKGAGALVNHEDHFAALISHVEVIPKYSVQVRVLATLMADFSKEEIEYLIEEQAVTADELRRVALLRPDFGFDVPAENLLEEARSMRGSWLDKLLD